MTARSCASRAALQLAAASGCGLLLLWTAAGCRETPPASSPANEGPAAEAPARPPAPRSEPPRPLGQQELAAGWIALFDGESLYGWRADPAEAWRVEDGAIVAAGGSPATLRTTTTFGEYELELRFRAEPGSEAAVIVGAGDSGEDRGVGATTVRLPPSDAEAAWRSCRIVVRGGDVRAALDGGDAAPAGPKRPRLRGSIALRRRQGRLAVRDIRLKPLGLAPLLNGKDLSGWKTYPDMPSVFSVTDDGRLHVRGGRGQLETEGMFGDFVLQLECMTHAPELNSGVFFRCVPGEQMNGYECQIHNGFLEGDRNRPKDCGTGGIFRRQNARFVAADDLAWFHLTLVADGPHMAAWVNGVQVSDWTDTRPPDPNPRRGLRLEPGTIMLQGHDPTTDISFRGLRAAELPPRPSAGS